MCQALVGSDAIRVKEGLVVDVAGLETNMENLRNCGLEFHISGGSSMLNFG